MKIEVQLKISSLLIKASFNFAKTMPQCPHWYTLKKNWDKNDFENTVEFIRKNGYEKEFNGREYTYYALNGYEYWTMGAPISQTILINKAKKKYESTYDKICNAYEQHFDNPKYKKEDKTVLSKVKIKSKTLDLGCGTGLLIDNIDIKPELYTGIDISQGMLNIFAKKHPKYAHSLINTSFEDFYSEKYDTIISLYGSCNYIDPKILFPKLDLLLNPSGVAYLLVYDKGVIPETHKVFNLTTNTYDYSKYGGEQVGNYYRLIKYQK